MKKDLNQNAKHILDLITGESPIGKPSDKNPAAVELGKLGGKRRAEKLTSEQRKEIAQNAAKKRWENKDKK